MLFQLHSPCRLSSTRKMYKLRHAGGGWGVEGVRERISLRNESRNIYSPPPDATPLVAKTSNRKLRDCVNYHYQLSGVEVCLSFFW